MKEFRLVNKASNKYFNPNENMVLLTFDDQYYMQAINLMLSVRQYNDNVSFICLCNRLSPEVKNEVLNKENKIGVFVCEYDINIVLPTQRWKNTTCLRVFAPWLIPENIQEVLYLDADMLVKGDLSCLFNKKDYLLIMANEIAGNTEIKSDGTNIYCNAGLAKMNLSLFREKYNLAEYHDAFFNHLNQMPYLDQDFLNFYIDDITKINGLIYNFQPYELIGAIHFNNVLRNCKVLHFSWQHPWDCNCIFPIYFNLYLRHSFYEPMIKIVKEAQVKNLKMINNRGL